MPDQTGEPVSESIVKRIPNRLLRAPEAQSRFILVGPCQFGTRICEHLVRPGPPRAADLLVLLRNTLLNQWLTHKKNRGCAHAFSA